MRQFFSIGLAVLIPLFTLEECDRSLVPALPEGGGYSAPASRPVPASPAPPRAVPSPAKIEDPGNIEGLQETHNVADPEDCERLAERFRSEGRRVTLTDVRRSSTPGSILPHVCVFEGPDAQSGYFDDTRYNPKDQYEP